MNYQLIAVWVLIAGSMLFIGRSLWKSLRGFGKGCGAGCGKCAPIADESATSDRIPLTQVKA